MVQSSNKWNSELINKLVPLYIVEQIMSMYFPNSEDQIKKKIMWLHHPTGSFFYKILQVDCITLEEILESFWHWSQGSNVYVENVAGGPCSCHWHWKIVEDINLECRLCNNALETTGHLMLHCQDSVVQLSYKFQVKPLSAQRILLRRFIIFLASFRPVELKLSENVVTRLLTFRLNLVSNSWLTSPPLCITALLQSESS